MTIAMVIILTMLILGVLLTVNFFPRSQRPQFSRKKYQFETANELTPESRKEDDYNIKPNVNIQALHSPQIQHQIPDRYYEDKISLLVRDPEWLFAYWDISNDTKQRIYSAHNIYEQSIPVIRVFNITAPDNITFFDIEIAEEATRCHIHVQDPENKFYVIWGRRKNNGEFIPILYSNAVETPRNDVSPILDPDWLPPLAYAHLLFKYRNLSSSIDLFKERND